MLWTAPRNTRTGVVITPWSESSLGVSLYVCGQGAPASQNFVAANVAVFVPFTIPVACTFTKMFWANGTAVAGNLDVGIFLEDGTRVVSIGTTGQVTVTNLQVVDITNTTLARGRYYMGICSDTSGVTQKVVATLPAQGIPQSLGLLEDAACAPPMSTNANPATFAAYTRAFIPLFGVQGYRTVGP